MVPLARRQALCVGIMSYNGQVNFGLVGDYDAMADLDSLALDVEGAIGEVARTVPQPAKRGPAPKPPAAATSSNRSGSSNGAKAAGSRAGKTAGEAKSSRNGAKAEASRRR
jgi:hypothetical protein